MRFIHIADLHLRDLRHVIGTIKILLDKKNIKSTEDFIYARDGINGKEDNA